MWDYFYLHSVLRSLSISITVYVQAFLEAFLPTQTPSAEFIASGSNGPRCSPSLRIADYYSLARYERLAPYRSPVLKESAFLRLTRQVTKALYIYYLVALPPNFIYLFDTHVLPRRFAYITSLFSFSFPCLCS